MSEESEIPLMMEREAGAPDHVAAIAVGFGMLAVENPKLSSAAGHPVFMDREHFKGVVPGDKNTVSCRYSTDKDRQRFPKAYAAFKQRETTPIQGMPIEQWPQVTRAQALNFKTMHVFTVEALAEVHDGHIDKLGQNARELRTKAKAFLDLAKDTAAAQKSAAENEQLRNQIAELTRQMTDLASRVGDQPKRGPGRPPKHAESEAA